MSTSTYLRSAVAVLALAFAAAGCAGGSGHGSSSSPAGPPTPPTTAAPSTTATTSEWPCLAGAGARTVRLTSGSEPDLDVAVIGSGPRAVVFSDESDQDLCSWLGYAKPLARSGFRVALYDYAGGPGEDIARISAYLRGHGAHAVALVGASEGAKGSIVAGTSTHPRAVVSLSAEKALMGLDVAPYAARLSAPTLFVTAADDIYGSAQATRGYYRSSPATAKRLVVVPGEAHGTALLATAAVARDVTAFLGRYDR